MASSTTKVFFDLFYDCEENHDNDPCPPLWPHESEGMDLCPLPNAIELNKLTAAMPNLPGNGWTRMAEDITWLSVKAGVSGSFARFHFSKQFAKTK